MRKKPNLFIVGAPKCGTTFLQVRLKEHPDVFMTSPKEPMYFADDIVDPRNHKFSREKYVALYENAPEVKYWGEACVWNLQSKTAANNIFHENPDAKIIIMLRNPFDAIVSMYHQNIYGRAETAKSINEALDLESSRQEGENIPPTCSPGNRLFYSQIMDFYPQVKRYTDLFPKNQVLILFQEDLKENSKEVLKLVYSFLDIPYVEQSIEKENTKRTNRFGWLRDMLESPPPFISFLGKIISPKTRSLLYKRIKTLNHSQVKEQKLSDQQILLLSEKWDKNIDLLSQLTKRDLSHWKQ